MRGKIFVFFFAVVFFSSVAQAIPLLEFENEQIREGETAFATITVDGEFKEEISEFQIEFFEGRKKVFVEQEIMFYEGVHHLTLHTTRSGQFTIKISQILYEEEGQLKAHTIEYPLNVSSDFVFVEEKNETVRQALSIRPGHFFSSVTPSISLINKGEVDLQVKFLDQEIVLGVAETREVTFEPEKKFSYLNVSSYQDFSVPIVYLSDLEKNLSAIQKEPELKVDPPLLFTNALVGEEQELVITLFNFADENITDMRFSVLNGSYLRLPEKTNLSGKQVSNFTIIFSPESVGNLKGEIVIDYAQLGKDAKVILPYSFFVLPLGSQDSDFNISASSCEDVDAVSCFEDCDGRGIFIEGGEFCCVGSCKPYSSGGGGDIGDEESGFAWGWVIGVLIIILLGLVGYAFYKKSKKVGSERPEDKIKSLSKDYSKKVSKGSQKVV